MIDFPTPPMPDGDPPAPSLAQLAPTIYRPTPRALLTRSTAPRALERDASLTPHAETVTEDAA